MISMSKIFQISISVLFITGINSSQFDVCQSVESFEVKTSFRLGQHLAVIADFSQSKNVFRGKAIRSVYEEHGVQNVSNSNDKVKHMYWDTTVWPQIEQVFGEKSNIKSAFTTFQITIFENQKTGCVVYLLYNDDTIEALEIEFEISDENTKPTFDVLRRKIVYDLQNKIDLTGVLNIRHLMLHFPKPEIRIDSLFMWPLTDSTQDFRRAFVYTSELYANKTYYMRHLMVAKLMTNKANRKKFVWSFDENNELCQTIEEKVDAVVYEKYGISNSYDGLQGTRFSMTIIEFSGKRYHRSLIDLYNWIKLHFLIREEFSNLDLIKCQPLPDQSHFSGIIGREFEPENKKCDDIAVRADDDVGEVDENGQVLDSKKSRTLSKDFWLWVIILVLVLIILTLGIVFYMQKYSAKKPSLEKKPNFKA